MTRTETRNSALEGARGIASLIVVVWHSTLAFLPQYTGIFKNLPAENALDGSLFFCLMNGTGAVTFFFVLSGYVLSRKSLITRNSDEVVKTALRRLPRLMLPVSITTIISFLLLHYGFVFYTKAASITMSPWLFTYGYANPFPFEPKFSDALFQGAWFTFIRGDSNYDSSLWTMRLEFIGSFIVFGMTLMLIRLETQKIAKAIFFTIIMLSTCYYISDWFIPFVAGNALAYFYPQTKFENRVFWFIRLFLILIGVFLLGYANPKGVFEIFNGFNPKYINTVGGVFIIGALCDLNINGKIERIAYFLGSLSFPLYLIHILVIFSIGSYVQIVFNAQNNIYTGVAVITFTIISSVFAALPLTWINNLWLNFVRKIDV